MLVGLTFASLLMSVAMGDAFAARAWLFVTDYLVLQIGRSAFLIVALRGRGAGRALPRLHGPRLRRPGAVHARQVLFARGAFGRVPRSRTWPLAAHAIVALGTAPLTLIAEIAAASAVLIAVAVANTVRDGVAPSRAQASSRGVGVRGP